MNLSLFGRNAEERLARERPKRRRDIAKVINAIEARLKKLEGDLEACDEQLENLAKKNRAVRSMRERGRIRRQAKRVAMEKQRYEVQETRCYNRLNNLRQLKENYDDQEDIRMATKVFSDVRKEYEQMPNSDALDAEEESLQVEEMFTNMDETADAHSRNYRMRGSNRYDDEDIDDLLNVYADGNETQDYLEDEYMSDETLDSRATASSSARSDGPEKTRSASKKETSVRRRTRTPNDIFAAVDDYSL